MTSATNRGPVDGLVTPRYGGPATFARLPRIDEVAKADVAIVGVPFDSGVSYRPGARFGPGHVRAASKLMRNYNPVQDVEPFAVQQVADAAALPLLRVMHELHGPVAVVHLDAHLDTWDTYFGAPVTHGTPFRRASEEGLIDKTGSIHVGIRGPLYSRTDLSDDQVLGFQVIGCHDMDDLGWRGAVARIKARVGNRPTYVSLDIDVLDPAFAPGTGTPEAGGLTSRELLNILRSFSDLNLVGADIVEVAPAYDHAEVTGIAAAHAAFELISAMAPRPERDDG